MSQIDDTLKLLQQGVKELPDTEKFKRCLDAMSKFYNYSVNNVLLIAMQMPSATHVASYTCWRDKFHRQVLKGEKGLTIIAPTPHKKQYESEVLKEDGTPVLNADGTPVIEKKEIVYNSFRICKVFDISQTAGEPLPELVSELTNPVEHFAEYLSVIKEITPVPVRFDNIDGGARGYYSPLQQEVVIKRGMAEEQTIKTLIHECAHVRLGHGGKDDKLDRGTKEVQAESVAYCCCKAIGLNVEEYSFPYVAGWASDREAKELTDSLQIIKEQAEQIISHITNRMQEILQIHQEKKELSLTSTQSIVTMKI